jgi:hypothetical protein
MTRIIAVLTGLLVAVGLSLVSPLTGPVAADHIRVDENCNEFHYSDIGVYKICNKVNFSIDPDGEVRVEQAYGRATQMSGNDLQGCETDTRFITDKVDYPNNHDWNNFLTEFNCTWVKIFDSGVNLETRCGTFRIEFRLKIERAEDPNPYDINNEYGPAAGC